MTHGPGNRSDFERHLAELRPKLHSYCARKLETALISAAWAAIRTKNSCLRAQFHRLKTPLRNAALERAETVKRGKRTGALLERGDMDIAPVLELQDQTEYACWRLRSQLLQHLDGQALVLLCLLWFDLVPCDDPLHQRLTPCPLW
jgi:hypothetical protein